MAGDHAALLTRNRGPFACRYAGWDPGASGCRAFHAARFFSYSSSSSAYTSYTQGLQPLSQQSHANGFSGGVGRGSESFMAQLSVTFQSGNGVSLPWLQAVVRAVPVCATHARRCSGGWPDAGAPNVGDALPWKARA